MSSIWDLLLQTISVSLTAGLIWLVKLIFEDKLSPRWQYGVWSVLALRILLPVQSARYIFPRLALWVEALKGAVEQGLNSAYTAIYSPIRLNHVLPWVDARPQSMTDYLFMIYAVGVILFLLRHLPAQLRLAALLKKGTAPAPTLQERMNALCQKYALKPCRIKVIEGLESAFVCGVFRPVLAVPSNDIDEKILLHELLHLKYKDIWQGLFWSLLRALHWCNPWMHLVFDCIGNDMESLCDQRVLERLEGEERREYGAILLEMANRRYARAPGTSSISNGGKNIARRIAAIVRFKKYPRGMALVSVCILILLAHPALVGQAATVDQELYTPDTVSDLTRSMASVRLNRCTTAAGAIDTYAKGLLTGNGLYIATVSPFSDHPSIEKELRNTDGNPFYLKQYSLIGQVATDYGYTILDLDLKKDGSYHCILAFRHFENGEDKTLLIPICAYQKDGWIVKETGERQLVDIYRDAVFQYMEIGAPRQFTATGKTGTITVYWRTTATIQSQYEQNDAWNLFSINSFNNTLVPNAKFSSFNLEFEAHYSCNGTPNERVSFIAVPLDDPKKKGNYPEIDLTDGGTGGGGGGELHGSWSIKDELIDPYETCSGSGYWLHYKFEDLPRPEAYAARIYWDNELVEELTLEEVLP